MLSGSSSGTAGATVAAGAPRGEGRRFFNIMADPRVRRGRTGGVPVANAAGAAGEGNFRATKPAGRRVRRRERQPWEVTVAEIHETIHVAPKKRVEVPIHLYLEEQADEVATCEQPTQTDEFVELPAAEPYLPPKAGFDASTQVDTGLVFSFDREVEGLLSVVVGKTIDQALMEVNEEAQLEFERARRERLNAQLATEAAERRKLEKAEEAAIVAKEAATREAVRRLRQKHATQRKLAAVSYAQHYVYGLQEAVFERLRRNGNFYDPVRRSVDAYVPELKREAQRGADAHRVARAMLDALCGAAVQRQASHAAAAKARRRREQMERARRVSIQLHVDCPMLADGPLGPLRMHGDATIGDVAASVREWAGDSRKSLGSLTFRVGDDGQELNNDTVLIDLGVESLSKLQLTVTQD